MHCCGEMQGAKPKGGQTCWAAVKAPTEHIRARWRCLKKYDKLCIATPGGDIGALWAYVRKNTTSFWAGTSKPEHLNIASQGAAHPVYPRTLFQLTVVTKNSTSLKVVTNTVHATCAPQS